MKNLTCYFRSEFVPVYGLILLNQRVITKMVENNRPKWSITMGIYTSLLALSLYIYSLIVDYYLNSANPTLFSMAVFQTMYVFAVAALLQISFCFNRERKSYLINLKLAFLFSGMLYVLNAFIVLPFKIYFEQGGSDLLTFLAAIIVSVWVIRCWYVIAEFNGLKRITDKLSSIVIISVLAFISKMFFAIIVPYFVNIT